jgi:cell division protein FtsI/penicillin-binding protein 2
MFQRRIAALLVIFLLGATGLIGRLFSVSVLQHGAYVALAAKQQSVERDILPQRGTIWVQDAATGQPSVLAESVESYTLSATPKNVPKKAEYAHLLANFAGVNEAQLLATFQGDSEYMPPIKQGLSKEDVENVAAQINALEKADDPQYVPQTVNFDTDVGGIIYFVGGVLFERQYQRVYPEGQLASQVLGFVNNSGKGQYGFESEYNSQLTGTTGQELLQTDSLGTLLGQTQTLVGHNGTGYELSIDRNVQFEVEQDLADSIKATGSTSGTVIVMNPKTGEIVALANSPTFDPANYQNVPANQISQYDDPAVDQIWEPGSIFKDIVMASALDTGAVTPETTSTFPESVTVQGYKIETALRRAYGTENMSQVLANSDNVAMVWVTDKLGNQNMYKYLRAFGLGQDTGIDLPNETAGELKPVDQWQDIDRATIAFGQGIGVSPLQMITAYSALANNGRMVVPRVVHAVISSNGTRTLIQPQLGAQVVKPQTAQEIMNMMLYTVTDADKKAEDPGYNVGGKTGTAQIPDPVNGGYIQDAYNHSFVGVEPTNDPQYVVLVKLDHPDIQKVGLYAESTALPLFTRISDFLLDYYQVTPNQP